jgi:dihydropyrimidinase
VDGGVSTLATDEYPTSLALKLRGRTIEDVTGGNLGAEARLGIAFTEGVVKRGMSLERFAAVHVSDYSPWEGWAVSGWPVTTLLRGRVIADRGRLLGGPGDGRLVHRRIDPVVLRRPVC